MREFKCKKSVMGMYVISLVHIVVGFFGLYIGYGEGFISSSAEVQFFMMTYPFIPLGAIVIGGFLLKSALKGKGKPSTFLIGEEHIEWNNTVRANAKFKIIDIKSIEISDKHFIEFHLNKGGSKQFTQECLLEDTLNDIREYLVNYKSLEVTEKN